MSDETRRGLLREAAETIDWAVDLIEMYDEHLIETHGDPEEKVRSETHLNGLRKARRVRDMCHEAARLSETGDQQELADDARTVADFIIGWWPGLEDAISWGDEGDMSGETNEVYQAAKRLRDRLQATEAGDGE